MSPFRCAAASHARDEPLAGTASTVRSFLLIQQPGPWGIDALRDSRMPERVSTGLSRGCRTADVRPLLIRRFGREQPDGVRVFAVYAHPVRPWAETVVLDDLADVLSLDLQALGVGRSPGLTPYTQPLFCVCTHGRHDVCCAERGRPLAAALSTTHPEQTWEISHIGGDRFAGNLLVLPDGLYYGRVDPEDGPRIATAHTEGRLELDHLRGRSGLGFAAQVAEVGLRRRLDSAGLGAVRLTRQRRVADGLVDLSFADEDGGRWRVRVRTWHGERQQLTCRSDLPRRALHAEVVSVAAATDAD